jgi:hypothetical protein
MLAVVDMGLDCWDSRWDTCGSYCFIGCLFWDVLDVRFPSQSLFNQNFHEAASNILMGGEGGQKIVKNTIFQSKVSV